MNFKKIIYEKLIEELKETNYMLGRVKLSWIRKIMNDFHTVTITDKKWRENIFSNNLQFIKLEEFQTLYDYWNFCDKNSGKFDVGHNSIELYKPVISQWVWYLLMCQLFPKELQTTGLKEYGVVKHDLYTNQYKQILSIKKLTGIEEEDKKIFYNTLKNDFFESGSPVRNGIILYYLWFKGDKRFF